MKTKTKLIVGIAVAVIIGLFAYNKMNAEELSGNFSLGYNSDFSFRGVDAGTSATQAGIGLETDVFGVGVGLDASVNIKDAGEDEVRLSASTSVDVLDSVTTSVGVVTYDNNHAIGDDTELFIALGAEIILSPGVKLFYNPNENHITTEGSISHAVSITEEIAVEAIGSVGHTNIGGDWGIYYGLDVVAGYSVSDNTQFYVGVLTRNLQDINLEEPDVSFVAGLNHSF